MSENTHMRQKRESIQYVLKLEAERLNKEGKHEYAQAYEYLHDIFSGSIKERPSIITAMLNNLDCKVKQIDEKKMDFLKRHFSQIVPKVKSNPYKTKKLKNPFQ